MQQCARHAHDNIMMCVSSVYMLCILCLLISLMLSQQQFTTYILTSLTFLVIAVSHLSSVCMLYAYTWPALLLLIRLIYSCIIIMWCLVNTVVSDNTEHMFVKTLYGILAIFS